MACTYNQRNATRAVSETHFVSRALPLDARAKALTVASQVAALINALRTARLPKLSNGVSRRNITKKLLAACRAARVLSPAT